MNHWSSSEAQPAVLSQLLAELVNRLRLSYVETHQNKISWPVCHRLGVQADLLTGLASEAGLEGLAQFAHSLAELAAMGRDEPDHIPPQWSGALSRLAEFLDEMMVGLDTGDAPAQWLTDLRWEKLTSWFTNLGSPFLVFDELEEILRRWQDSWCDGTLGPKQEAELQDRWLHLRNFGDALFKLSGNDDPQNLLRWDGFQS